VPSLSCLILSLRRFPPPRRDTQRAAVSLACFLDLPFGVLLLTSPPHTHSTQSTQPHAKLGARKHGSSQQSALAISERGPGQ